VFDLFATEFTFQETHEIAEKFAAGLLAAGLKPGDKVAVWGPNQPEWYIMKWATAKVGMPLVSLNPLYTVPELEYAMNKVGAKALVCPKELGPLNYNAALTSLIPDLDKQDKFNLKSSAMPELKTIVYYTCYEEVGGVIRWDELEEMGSDKNLTEVRSIKVDPHSNSNIQFTSGTTGRPKAAGLSHYGLVNNAISVETNANKYADLTVPGESKILNMLPLYHVFSYLGGSMWGAYSMQTNIYPTPGFNADAALNCIAEYQCSSVLGTPTMIVDMINSPIVKDLDLSSLQWAVLGGSPVSKVLAKRAKETIGCDVTIVYGMTENSGGTFQTPMGKPDETGFIETVGEAYQGVQAKIIDKEGNTVPKGTIGELCTKGYFVFTGYINDEEKTKESFTEDGFFKTGDLAMLREDGMIKITGREKDLIIRGGENIQPTEIEDFINEIPEVKATYVIGVPSKRLDEEVAAYIHLDDNATITKEEVIAHCKNGLARFKHPKYIKFEDTYPLTTTGKVQKFLLQKQAMEDFPSLKDEI